MNKFNGFLEKIEAVLLQFEMPVYYGRTFAKQNDKWNYFVFNRQYFNNSGSSRNDINYYYQVHIIQENYIEEGLEFEIIQKLKPLGLKLTGTPQYNYTTKGGTDMVVEMLTLTFTKTCKGCDI